MIKALIFDLDGTLLDTLEDICDVVNNAMRSNGFPEKTLDEVRLAVGRGIETLVGNLFPEMVHKVEFVQSMADKIRNSFAEMGTIKTNPYPGVPELLNRLQVLRIPIAVLTNKPQISADKAVRKHFGGISFISVAGARKGLPLKPSPEAARPVMELLDALPQEILMVGDSDVDIETALNSGMVPVGVSWGFRSVESLREHGAEHIITHPMNLLNLLRRPAL